MKLNSIERKVLRMEEMEKIKMKIEQLLEWLGRRAEVLRKEGINIDDSFRISINAFSDVYSSTDIENDQNMASLQEKKFAFKPLIVLPGGRNISSGDLLELIKTFLFNKYLKEKFISIRSSLYDDYFNGVDNVIIDKKSGRVICAIDETSAMSGKILEEKFKKVMNKNKAGGVNLKYGLFIKNNQMIKGPISNIPYLYLPLEKRYVLALTKDIDFEKENKTEMRVLMFFLQLINQQISMLRLENKLNDWSFFEDIEGFILKYLQGLQIKVRSKNI